MPSLTGSFLVARPVLRDPNFTQTVVLLLQHGADGAFGLVVNRPARVEGLPFPVYFGGPCKAEGLLMLHGHADWTNEEDASNREMAPGVFMGDASCLGRIENAEEGETLHFRVFSGYSGWGPDQLEQELTEGAWSLRQANGELLFEIAPEDLWERLAATSIPMPSVN